jgi:hypothetical protein
MEIIMNVNFLILRDSISGYKESSVLILSKIDGSEFNLDDAVVELVDLVELSLKEEYNSYMGFLPRWDYIHSSIRRAYWGDEDSLEWHEEVMNKSGWTNSRFPLSADIHYIVEEDAVKWMFDYWSENNPTWKDDRIANLKASALHKLTGEEIKALGI